MLRKAIFSLLFIGISAIPAFSQQLIDGIAAVVGKEIILRSEIEQYIQSYVIQNRIDVSKDKSILEPLRKQVLERLIEQKILLNKADEDTLKVDDQMVTQRVDERMNYLISQVGSEEKLEEVFGSSIRKIRKDTAQLLKEQMLVEMARSNKFKSLKVSRREVEDFYKTYRDSLPGLEETVDLSHILKLIKPSEEAQTSAFEKISQLLERIKNGEDFSKLAETYSEDPASSKRGGDLGLINRGDFVPEFEAAAFALKDGEISDIVQSQFGFHIIQMIERRGEKIRTRHILIRAEPTEADEQRVVDLLNTLRGKALAGEDFATLASENSDDENVVKDKGHLGIFESDKLVIPEFKTEIDKLKPGEISLPFKTDYGYHIVRLNAKQDKRILSLDNDWQRIEEFALNKKMEKEYYKWILELKKTISISVQNPA